MTLVIATRNKGKAREIKELVKRLPIKLLFLDNFQNLPDVKEDGSTFQENAFKKAETIAEITGYPTLAEDSGLEVDALDGKPGVYSARFASGMHRMVHTGDRTRDIDNINKVLDLMKGIPEGKRQARFKAVVCLCFPDGRKKFVEGICKGKIAFVPHGKKGFGYDPVFIPDGYDKTFAGLGEEIKNKISHRAKAMTGIKKILLRILGSKQ